MINAGAIAAASLVAGHSPEDRLHRVLGVYSLFAGRQLTLDPAVYESERDTGHRNRAIGHMLRNFGILSGDPEPDLNLYFQQCSVQVSCRDLSLMAATLANGGVNPISGERAIREDLVGSVLSVMTTCGMYDFAGEWVYAVGMPAKSGVGGGIIAVLPGQLGIGVFSPRLDARGNSVRGVQVCKRISADFHLHFLNVARSSRATVRARYSLADVPSKRLRSDAERAALEDVGRYARIFELQGDLGFPSVEAVTRRLVGRGGRFDYAVLDMRRVPRIERAAARILVELRSDFARSGKTVVFSGLQHHPELLRRLEAEKKGGQRIVFPELDSALEWCEDQLLQGAVAAAQDSVLPLAAHGLCRNLSPDQVSVLEARLERRRYQAGEYIVRKGEVADALYLLVAGKVSVVVDLPSGQLKRLSTVSPGMSFGELAALDRELRTADVRADMVAECYVLPAKAFEELATAAPDLHIALLRNLMRNLAKMVSRLDREIAALVE
jgi:glutaminase